MRRSREAGTLGGLDAERLGSWEAFTRFGILDLGLSRFGIWDLSDLGYWISDCLDLGFGIYPIWDIGFRPPWRDGFD
jgi:hypothetical protein